MYTSHSSVIYCWNCQECSTFISSTPWRDHHHLLNLLLSTFSSPSALSSLHGQLPLDYHRLTFFFLLFRCTYWQQARYFFSCCPVVATDVVFLLYDALHLAGCTCCLVKAAVSPGVVMVDVGFVVSSLWFGMAAAGLRCFGFWSSVGRLKETAVVASPLLLFGQLLSR